MKINKWVLNVLLAVIFFGYWVYLLNREKFIDNPPSVFFVIIMSLVAGSLLATISFFSFMKTAEISDDIKKITKFKRFWPWLTCWNLCWLLFTFIWWFEL